MTVLKDIYSGLYFECGGVRPHGEKFLAAQRALDEIGDELAGDLDKRQGALFSRFQNEMVRYALAGREESFEQGFRTGARLMMEIFEESGEKPCN